MSLPFVLVVTGPTASGKTALVDIIASKVPCEIINADVGQFYTPLSIGTAKSLHWPVGTYHGFDLFNAPHEYNVLEYRKSVIKWVNEIHQRGKLPIIVGGSLFYIKSLFFPPVEAQEVAGLKQDIDFDQESGKLWEVLNSIDPERARALHPNDRYRIVRALTLWQKTGRQPSSLKAELSSPFKSLVVAITPPREVLDERIKVRTNEMIEGGWLEEARSLLGTPWEAFIQRKGMIGYTEIFDWIKQGELKEKLPELITTIQIKTRQYAGRQLVFWAPLKRELEKSPLITIETVESVTQRVIEQIIGRIQPLRDTPCSQK